MWNKILEYGRQIFALTRDVEKCKTDIKELREDFKELSRKVDRLIEAVQRLSADFNQDRSNAERDRKILLLQLENAFFRHERGLPPGNLLEDKPDAE